MWLKVSVLTESKGRGGGQGGGGHRAGGFSMFFQRLTTLTGCCRKSGQFAAAPLSPRQWN